MIVTTTPDISGYQVTEYLGIVAGEAVMGVNMFRDLGASLRNVFGGRSAGYEDEMQRAREEVISEMMQRSGASCSRRRAARRTKLQSLLLSN